MYQLLQRALSRRPHTVYACAFYISLSIGLENLASAAVFKFVATSNVKLNDQGTVAFVARVEDQGKETEALFLALKDGSLLTIASVGQASPIPGFRFRGVGQDFVRYLSLNNRNNVTFTTSITNGRREDDKVGLFFYSFAKKHVNAVMTSITSPDPMTAVEDWVEEFPSALNNSDEVAFVASKIGTCVPPPGTVGCIPPATRRLLLYSAAEQALTEIIRTSNPAGQAGGIGPPLLNNLGTLVFAVAEQNSFAYFRKLRSQTPRQIEPKGDFALLIDGFGEPQLNDQDTIVFTSPLKSGDSLGGIFAIRRDDRLTAIALDKQQIGDNDFFDFTRRGIFGGIFFAPPTPHLNNFELIVFAGKRGTTGRFFLTNPEGAPLTAILPPSPFSQFIQFNNRSEILYSDGSKRIVLRESSGDFRVVLDTTRTVAGLFGLLQPYALNENREVGFFGTLNQLLRGFVEGHFVLEVDTGEIRKVVLIGETVPAVNTETERSRRRP